MIFFVLQFHKNSIFNFKFVKKRRGKNIHLAIAVVVLGGKIINKGDFIIANYGWSSKSTADILNFPCNCGESNCTKTLFKQKTISSHGNEKSNFKFESQLLHQSTRNTTWFQEFSRIDPELTIAVGKYVEVLNVEKFHSDANFIYCILGIFKQISKNKYYAVESYIFYCIFILFLIYYYFLLLLDMWWCSDHIF